MSEEEQKTIELLKKTIKNSNYCDSIGTGQIEILLNLIHKQEKIIDSLAQWVSNLSPMVDKQAVKDIIYKENKDE